MILLPEYEPKTFENQLYISHSGDTFYTFQIKKMRDSKKHNLAWLG